MAVWQVLAVMSGVAALAASLNYNLRVDRLIQTHNGFSLGFARHQHYLNLDHHHIDKTHPSYPQDMDRELESFGVHRRIMIIALVIFAAFALFGFALKARSWWEQPLASTGG